MQMLLTNPKDAFLTVQSLGPSTCSFLILFLIYVAISTCRSFKEKKRFDLHSFLTNLKVMSVEVATTIAFLYWVGRSLLHELAK